VTTRAVAAFNGETNAALVSRSRVVQCVLYAVGLVQTADECVRTTTTASYDVNGDCSRRLIT
jgi:hypothetical protein